jgi:ganglioside-induced differentiation-associated protein 1
MQFYTYPLAYNPQKAKLALVEKGLEHKDEFINLFSGQSLSPEYLKINANGTVPTLVDGETLADTVSKVLWTVGCWPILCV